MGQLSDEIQRRRVEIQRSRDEWLRSKAVCTEAIKALIERITKFLHAEVLSDRAARGLKIDSSVGEMGDGWNAGKNVIEGFIGIFDGGGFFGKRKAVFNITLKSSSDDVFKSFFIYRNYPMSDFDVGGYGKYPVQTNMESQIMQRIKPDVVSGVASYLIEKHS